MRTIFFLYFLLVWGVGFLVDFGVVEPVEVVVVAVVVEAFSFLDCPAWNS